MALSRVVANLLVFSALGFVVAAKADDVAATPSTPRERLERATAASSLEDMNAKPWHMKLSVTLFDVKGKNPVDGTIEYWKSSDDWLRVITVGADMETMLHHDGQTYRGVSGAEIPDLAINTFEKFLHPGPFPDDYEGSTPELRKQYFGKVSLACIMLTQPLKRFGVPPLGLFPTYCLQLDTNHLVASYDFGSRGITINRIGQFMDHDIAVEFSMSQDAVIVAKGKVLSLTLFTPLPETFQPASQSKTLVPIAKLSTVEISKQRLHDIAPVYPQSAKENHISGTVTMHAIVGRDGHVHNLYAITAPDPSLAASALTAARQWIYKPYLLNGEPVEVDTTLIIHYRLGD